MIWIARASFAVGIVLLNMKDSTGAAAMFGMAIYVRMECEE